MEGSNFKILDFYNYLSHYHNVSIYRTLSGSIILIIFLFFYLFVSEDARDMAWKQCMNGADPSQVDQLGLTGSESRGVAITFGPTRLNLIETAAAAQNVNNE